MSHNVALDVLDRISRCNGITSITSHYIRTTPTSQGTAQRTQGDGSGGLDVVSAPVAPGINTNHGGGDDDEDEETYPHLPTNQGGSDDDEDEETVPYLPTNQGGSDDDEDDEETHPYLTYRPLHAPTTIAPIAPATPATSDSYGRRSSP